jgi:hypothetical protein
MGDIGLLTTQELAEFIDPVELAGSPDEAEEFADCDSEACADQLPLRIALTDTLTVRASRKGNPIAKNRWICRGFRLSIPRAAKRDYFILWFAFLDSWRPRADSRARQDTREPTAIEHSLRSRHDSPRSLASFTS